MSPKLTIIVPCYNEFNRLDSDAFINFSKAEPDFKFLFVDDGSSDQTSSKLKELCSKGENLDCLILEINKGKAEAIRSGVNYIIGQKKDYDYIGYIDADLAVPLNELRYLRTQLIEKPELRFMMGIRLARLGAQIDRKPIRHYLGRVFATVVSLMLGEQTYDTQCGAKFIHKSIARQLFADGFKSKWFFDVELIFRLKIHFPEVLKENQALEVPLNEWKEVGNSRLKFIDFLKAPVELLSIKSKYSRVSKSKSKS